MTKPIEPQIQPEHGKSSHAEIRVTPMRILLGLSMFLGIQWAISYRSNHRYPTAPPGGGLAVLSASGEFCVFWFQAQKAGLLPPSAFFQSAGLEATPHAWQGQVFQHRCVFGQVLIVRGISWEQNVTNAFRGVRIRYALSTCAMGIITAAAIASEVRKRVC